MGDRSLNLLGQRLTNGFLDAIGWNILGQNKRVASLLAVICETLLWA